jgi:CO/xanthine dehydrogenase Mo-binding subunit
MEPASVPPEHDADEGQPHGERDQRPVRAFMDYLKPTSADVPDIEVDHLEHPSPFTPLGAKGVGEGGAIPGPAAVANAVEDALAPFGAVIRSLPITPERVWRLMRTAP